MQIGLPHGRMPYGTDIKDKIPIMYLYVYYSQGPEGPQTSFDYCQKFQMFESKRQNLANNSGLKKS